MKMHKMPWALALAFVLAVGATGARANEAAPLAEDPVVEARLVHISEDLRRDD